MKLKELKEVLNKHGYFFDNCDVVIGDTCKIAAGVKSAGVAELPPVSWDVSDLAFYITPTTELRKKETPVERPRRTFEEIGKELNTKLGVEWGKVRFFDNRMEFRSVNKTDLVIFDNGGMYFEVDAAMYSEIRLCTFQIAAISAACTEIAALRKEEA